ncbi:phosphoribosyltransferase [Patescibacteria group bacterium]|nr:phosphoribosyltransferase [Patescibacteria group bacterium]MBU1499690.1 phosphoribosyltransferase [Patescibacteria group bacterium]
MTQGIETVQNAFAKRLDQDELINFSRQEAITQRATELWAGREKVIGEAKFIPAPVSGFFPDCKDVWAVKSGEVVESNFPYIWAPAVDSTDKLLAIATRGLELKKEGKRAALVTNFVMEQRMEREVKDYEGKLHGIPGIEMELLHGVTVILAQGFPRGVMHVDGHGLGFEHWAGENNLPVFTMTAMPKLIKSAFDKGMIDDVRTVAVSGDVGGVMMMNMVAEIAASFGLEVETVYGEKRAAEVFTSWGRKKIKGAQVLFGDDIIVSGKTVFQKVLKTAFEVGAKNAVVLVPHADLVSHTLENLDNCEGDVSLVVGDTFPVRPEAASANKRLLRVPVFESVKMAAEMDALNLLADVFTNEATQAELFRQTGLAIFPSYVSRYRTVSDMLK